MKFLVQVTYVDYPSHSCLYVRCSNCKKMGDSKVIAQSLECKTTVANGNSRSLFRRHFTGGKKVIYHLLTACFNPRNTGPSCGAMRLWLQHTLTAILHLNSIQLTA